MIALEVVLVCDGCNVGLGASTQQLQAPVLRKQLEWSRDQGKIKGWATYRLSPTSSFGDYCTRCQAKHRKAKEKKGAAK